MALIDCPECGKEVSDKALSCPNCGYPITVAKRKRYKLKAKFIPFLILIIAAIIGTAVYFLHLHDRKAAEEQAKEEEESVQTYNTNVDLIYTSMLSGAVKSESICNVIYQVWHNTIYGVDDETTNKYTKNVNSFNEAIANLFADEDFKADIEELERNQKTVNTVMKNLKNPPEELKEEYDILKDCYDLYTRLADLAVNPSGSLSYYSSEFREIDAEFVNKLKILKLYTE